MSYQQKDGDIVLFTNERKNETQPVLRGELFLDGNHYEIALWGKTSQKGNKFWAGQVSPKGAFKAAQERRKAAEKMPASENKPEFDDQIPF